MTGIYLLPLRHPLPVARQLASMANLAPGRMIFGVGIGGEDPHELEVCGVNPKRRGVRANESLAIIKGLLAGESVTSKAKNSACRTPLFARSANPNTVVVGDVDAALARTAKFGEGGLVVVLGSRFSQAVVSVHEQAGFPQRRLDARLSAMGWIRSPQCRCCTCAVKAGMEAFYRIPFGKFERYTPSGTPAQVAEQLAPHIESGCRLFNLKVCCEHPEEEVVLGRELVAELRQFGVALAS